MFHLDDDPTDTAPKQAATITLPQGVLVAVVTAILSSGGVSVLSGGGATPEDVQALRHDIDRLSEKLDEIYYIVDRAHPRTGIDK